LIFSRSDKWTDVYMNKLKPFKARYVAQMDFSLVSFGPTKPLLDLVTMAGIFSIPIITNLMVLCRTTDMFIGFSAITNIVAMTGVMAQHHLADLQKRATGWFSQTNFTWVPSAATVVLLLLFGVGKAVQNIAPTALQRAFAMGTSLAALTSLSTVMHRTWNELFPVIYEKVHGEPLVLEECLVASTKFKTLVENMEIFEAEEGVEKLRTSRSHCERVMEMCSDLQRLYKDADLRRVRAFTPAVRYIERTLDEWKRLALASAHKVSQSRVEPVVIQLYGESGIGKSTLVEVLAQDVLFDRITWTGPDDTIANHIFTRNPSSSYWDGYTGQQALLLDDFMQLVDTPTNPNPEILDMIRMKNTAPFPLPMAELSDKAKSFFRSKLVVVTTNTLNFDAKSITYPQALARRIDVKVRVERPRAPTTALDTSVYEFHLYQDDYKVKVCNYDELVWLLREKLDMREKALDERGTLLKQRRLAPKVYTPSQLDSAWSKLISNGASTAREPPMLKKFRSQALVPQVTQTEEMYLEPVSNENLRQLRALLEEVYGKTIDTNVDETTQSNNSGSPYWYFKKFLRICRGETQLTPLQRIARIDFLSVVKQTVNKVPSTMSKILEWFVDHAQYFQSLGITVCSVFLQYLICKIFVKGILKFVDHDQDKEDKTTISLDDYIVPATATSETFISRDGAKSHKRPAYGMRAEGQIDPTAEHIMRQVTQNTYAITLENNKTMGYITLVRGRIGILNKHVALALSKFDNFQLRDKASRNYYIRQSESHLMHHPSLDLSFIVLPKTFRSHTDIVRHFVKAEDIQSKKYTVRSTFLREGDLIRTVGRGELTTKLITVESVQEDVPNWTIAANHGIHYDGFETMSGDCGALISILEPTMNRKILAMHTAGNGSSGLGFIITQEIVEATIKSIAYSAQTHVDIPFGLSDDNTPFVAHATPTFEPERTLLRPTPLQEIFEPKKQPAIIKRYKDLDPMDRTMTLLQKPKFQLSVEDNNLIIDAMKHFFYKGEISLRRKLTLDEATFGIEDLEPICVKTSPGYPFCLDNKAYGKRCWIDVENKTIEQSLRDRIEQKECELRNGVLTEPFLFKDSLKDEKRKLAHTDLSDPTKVKTRMFSASPMDLTLLLKMYYGAFFQHMTRNRITNTSAVGINPYGLDWERLVHHLREVDDLADDGDYANFDTSESASLILAFLKVANDWYDEPEHDDIRTMLAEQVAFPYHISRGRIYPTDGGLPSGTYGTTHINCGVNLSLFILAYREVTGFGIQDFAHHVRLVTYGDDNIFSVSKERSQFTSTAIGRSLQQFGFTYTPVNKDALETQARAIENCTFLQRGFAHQGKYWRAPLKLDSCVEMMLWITKSRDPEEAMMDNIRTAMEELAITQPTGEIRDRVARFLQARGLYEHLSHNTERLEILDRDFF